MKKCILLITAVLFCTQIFAQTTWTNDPNHSRLGFTIEHMGISEITGAFDEFSAKIILGDGQTLSHAKIQLDVTVGSINTNVEPRDKHLRSADFFEVESYPTMRFESSSVRETAKDTYEVKGQLDLHGVTKEVVVEMKLGGIIEDPQNPDVKTMGIQIVGTINRSDFGIGAKFPEAMLGDAVYIKADGEFKNQ